MKNITIKNILVSTVLGTSLLLSPVSAFAEHEDKQVTVSQSTLNQITLILTGLAEQIGNILSPAEQAMSNGGDLRVVLNKALQEHVDLGLETLRNAYDGSDAFDASFDALLENSDDIAGAVASVYGDAAGDSFLSLWNDHIGFFADFTVGLKTNDDSMVEQAEDDLKDYGLAAGDFFSRANPFIPNDAVVALAGEHGNLIKDSMRAYDEGDYEESYELGREATAQVQKIADALAGGILKQFPEKF